MSGFHPLPGESKSGLCPGLPAGFRLGSAEPLSALRHRSFPHGMGLRWLRMERMSLVSLSWVLEEPQSKSANAASFDVFLQGANTAPHFLEVFKCEVRVLLNQIEGFVAE